MGIHSTALRGGGSVHRPEEPRREVACLGGVLRVLLDRRLLLRLLGRRRHPRVLRHRRLEVLVPRQGQHIDAVLLAVRQTALYKTLKKKINPCQNRNKHNHYLVYYYCVPTHTTTGIQYIALVKAKGILLCAMLELVATSDEG